MTEVGKKSKITFHWKVSPYDYSKEKVNSIIAKASKKYGIPRERIRVVPDFLMVDEKGKEMSLSKDVIQNIQDPNFQLKLFDEYIRINDIEGYDIDLIKKIDSDINGKIDYQNYDKHRQYAIKWIRWDNFLSYGADNFLDFTGFRDFVLLTGKPHNQSGKTTLSIDLIHFLLFGKTDKADVQSKIFNKHIPEATNVVVEGCIEIDGEDYIIKRTLSRPSLDKRTEKSKVTQKVEYYKIVGGSREELEEYIDNQQEENSIQTNKVIKEAIGKESDFDLAMSITESNLDALIEKKDTERGRLLSRWIGLQPLEEKDAIAREKFNTEIKPYLLSNKYNSEALKQEITAFETQIKSFDEIIQSLEKSNKSLDKEIKVLEDNKSVLLRSKKDVKDNLLKIDITTLNRSIEDVKNEGIRKKAEHEKNSLRIKEIGDVDFSVEKYDKEVNNLSSLKEKRGILVERLKNVKYCIENLKAGEYCPVCKRKLDNVDNTPRIKEQEAEMDKIITEGKDVSSKIADTEKHIESMKTNRELFNEKSKLNMSNAALEVSMATLREQYKDLTGKLKEYKENSEAIDNNNNIDIQIRNNDVQLNEKRRIKENNVREIVGREETIKSHRKEISDRKDIIEKISIEEKVVKNWKIYLELVGKNGISKMVFRKALPIINAKLSELLSDVCDFDVEVGINMKNDVMFYLIKDGVKSDLLSASGFEKTVASLALRSVLAELSTIPKMSSIIIDEIYGRTSRDNYDNLMNLLRKICKNYSYMFFITHNEEIKAYCDTEIVVEKKDNISRLKIEK